MTDEAPKKPVRWGRIILVLSLALNLLVVGLVFGAHISGEGGRKDLTDTAGRHLGLGPYLKALPGEDRRLVIQAARGAGGSDKDVRKRLKQGFDEIVDAIVAEPFDREAIEALIVGQREHVTQRLAVGQKALLDRVEAMTAEERAAYAKELAKTIKRGPRRR